MITSYVSLDVETTGLNPKLDKIIEIGAIKVENGMIIDSFESFINPGRRLDENIIKLTGIKNHMLENAPNDAQIIPAFLAFAQDAILVGHRILFDYSFVKKAAVNLGLPFEKNGIDTLKIARKHLQHLESRRLIDLCQHYQIPHSAHRALADAKATAQLYDRLGQDYYTEQDFKPLPLLYKTKKEVPITKPQKERLYKLLDKHKITIDYEIDMLTKNHASRIIDKILLKYGR